MRQSDTPKTAPLKKEITGQIGTSLFLIAISAVVSTAIIYWGSI